jgi:hypothetical protein
MRHVGVARVLANSATSMATSALAVSFFTPKGQRRERFLPKNIGFGFHPEGMAESSRGVERSEDPRKTVLL